MRAVCPINEADISTNPGGNAVTITAPCACQSCLSAPRYLAQKLAKDGQHINARQKAMCWVRGSKGSPVPGVSSDVLAAVPLVRDTQPIGCKAVPLPSSILGIRDLQVDGDVSWQRLCVPYRPRKSALAKILDGQEMTELNEEKQHEKGPFGTFPVSIGTDNTFKSHACKHFSTDIPLQMVNFDCKMHDGFNE